MPLEWYYQSAVNPEFVARLLNSAKWYRQHERYSIEYETLAKQYASRYTNIRLVVAILVRSDGSSDIIYSLSQDGYKNRLSVIHPTNDNH